MRRVVGLLFALMFAVAPQVYAQGTPLVMPEIQFTDQNGVPLSGGLLYTCQQGQSCPGTTQLTYTDGTLGTPNANPVVLDSAGRASVYLSAATYKFVLQTSLGVQVWTKDNVPASAGWNITRLVGTTIVFQTPTILTLSANAVTPTQNVHALDTSGGAANLNTINTSGVTAPFILYLYGNNTASDPVTIKNGVGNITLIGGDYTLDGPGKWLSLMLKGTTWFEVARAGWLAASQVQTIASNVLTLNYQAGPIVNFTLNANITTTTLTNIPPSGQFASFTFIVTGNGSSFTWAWFTSTVHWPSAVAPTITSTNGKVDVFTVFTIDGGTTWRGIPVGQNY